MSLRELIIKRKSLPLSAAARLVRGAADALGALHAKEIVSGGLSPETIRVTGTIQEPSQLLLTPLGLTNLKQIDALAGGDDDAAGDRLRDYMSPEQRAGGRPDSRSDVYSLGLVFVEMLGTDVHGRPWATAAEDPKAAPPPTSRGFFARLRGASSGATNKLTREVPLPAGIPARWSDFLARCVAVDPSARYQNGSELLAAIPAA